MAQKEPWISAADKLCPDRDWSKELGESSTAQVQYLATLFHDPEARDAASDETMAWLQTLRDCDVIALFVLLQGRWPRPDGDSLLPGEKELAGVCLQVMNQMRAN